MVSTRIYEIKDSDRKRFPESTDPSAQSGKGGIVQQRHTTDVLFFLAIVGIWALMSVVGGMAAQNGNLDLLIHPVDDRGNICGITLGFTDKPKFYTISPLTGLGSCIAACPTSQAPITSTNPNDYYCLSWVKNLGFSTTQMQTYLKTTCMSTTTGTFSPKNAIGSCGCNLLQNTTSIFDRCVFTDPAVRSLYPSQDYRNYFLTFMSDIIAARNVIFAFGLLASLFAAFLYTHLLRFRVVGLITIWTCIISLVGICGLFVWLGVVTVQQWQQENPVVHSKEGNNIPCHYTLKQHITPHHHNKTKHPPTKSPITRTTTTEQVALTVLFVFVGVCSGLFLCVCISLRKQIDIAVRVMSLAATALEAMPLIVLSPLIQCAGLALFGVPFMFYSFNVASSGTFVKQYASCSTSVPGLCSVANAALNAGATSGSSNSSSIYVGVHYEFSKTSAEQLWYLFFCFLWTMNFIAGIGTLVIAVSVARWYFTTPDERAKVTSLSVFRAYTVVLRYHMGTASFGGLLISVVQFARWVALYMEKHFKQTGKGPQVMVIRVVFCCVDCCLCCLESCMKFISRNAYIQTAIHGGGFCSGCKEAFFAIARNILSIGAVSVVSGLGLVVGKIWICVSVGLASFYWFSKSYANDLHSLVAPTIFVMILAYITASVFMDVFHTAIDTVIMCYIHDSEGNGGHPVYAFQSMTEFLREHGPIKVDEQQPQRAVDGNLHSVI